MSPIKKTLAHPKANADAQLIFQNKIKTYQQDGRYIVYIDESGFAHDMPRQHGYSLKGKPCHGLQNWQAGGRTNVIGAISGKLMLTAMLFPTNIDADVFYGWVQQDLLPKCPPNSVIVMDNATFHKRSDIQKAITQAGHILEYLPPYSPHLNPIKRKWAQAKAIRRKYLCPIEHIFKDKLNHFN